MSKFLASFAVVCCLFIASGYGEDMGADRYELLDFDSAVYNIIRSRYNGTFGISPFGVRALLIGISDDTEIWRSYRIDETACYAHLRYKEPVERKEHIAGLIKNDFRDVQFSHMIQSYVSDDSFYPSSSPKDPNSPFLISPRFLEFRSNARTAVIQTMRGRYTATIARWVPPDIIDRNVKYVLNDQMSFQGRFKKELQRSISKADFLKNGKYIVKIRYLHLRDEVKFVHSDEMRSTIVEIPYQEGGFSMIFILPDADVHIDDPKTELDLRRIWGLLDSTDKFDVLLQIPNLKMDSFVSLKRTLMKMDLPEEQRCYPLKNDTLGGYMARSDIRQNTFVSVSSTEPATEEDIYRAGNTTQILEFNRPFLAIVRYKNFCLSIAKITDPITSIFVPEENLIPDE